MARSRGSTAPIAEAEAAVASVLDLVTGQDAADRPRRARPSVRAQGGARVLGRAGASGRGRLRRRAVAEPGRGGDGAVPGAGRARQAADRSRPGRSSASPGSRPARPRWASPGCTSRSRASARHRRRSSRSRSRGRCCCWARAPRTRWPRAFTSGGRSGCSRSGRRCSSASVADELAPLFACAALLAGVALPAGLPKPSDELLRAVTRAHRPQAAEGAHAAGVALRVREVRSRRLARRRAAHGGSAGPHAGRRRRRVGAGAGRRRRAGRTRRRRPRWRRTRRRWICSASRWASSTRCCGRGAG